MPLDSVQDGLNSVQDAFGQRTSCLLDTLWLVFWTAYSSSFGHHTVRRLNTAQHPLEHRNPPSVSSRPVRYEVAKLFLVHTPLYVTHGARAE